MLNSAYHVFGLERRSVPIWSWVDELLIGTQTDCSTVLWCYHLFVDSYRLSILSFTQSFQ